MTPGAGAGARRLAALALAAAVALSAQGAAAERPGRVGFLSEGLPEGGPRRQRLLTGNELEHCVLLERDINAGAAAMEVEESWIAARRAELESLGQEIDGRAGRVDRTSKPALRHHNDLVYRQRSLADEFNARLPAFNARVQRHNARMAAFNGECAAKPFAAAAMRAVRARLLLP